MLETRVIERTARFRGFLAPALLLAGVLLGGSSSGGAIVNLVLMGFALCVLLATIWLPSRGAMAATERQVMWIFAAFVLVGLLQLVPLPPAIWSALPGRQEVVRGFTLVGAPLPWLPLSLDGLASLKSLLPAVIALAAFRAVRACEDRDLALIPWAVAIAAGGSILLGLAQLTGGVNSPLRLYAITNNDQSVGFFANSNHLATLLVLTLPFIGALGRRRFGRMKSHDKVPQIVALAALALLILAGAVIAGSIAGIALLVPALLGAMLIVMGRTRTPLALAGIVGAFVAMAALIFLATRSDLLSGFAATSFGLGQTGRTVIYTTTFDAIRAYFPFGSGLGTFVQVYPWFENAAKVESTFVNHAHSDYLELVLETGVVGILLLVAFFAWWLRRAAQIWLGRDETSLAKAATLASGIILAHSAVDYPMRTGAILIVFSICIALMARPNAPPTAASSAKPKVRHLSVG